jgi:hypothetical protein
MYIISIICPAGKYVKYTVALQWLTFGLLIDVDMQVRNHIPNGTER